MADTPSKVERRSAKKLADIEKRKVLDSVEEQIQSLNDANAAMQSLMASVAEGSNYITSQFKSNYGEMEKYLTQQERLFGLYSDQISALDAVGQRLEQFKNRISSTKIALAKDNTLEAGTVKFLKNMSSGAATKKTINDLVDKINANASTVPGIVDEFIKDFNEGYGKKYENFFRKINEKVELSEGIDEKKLNELLDILALPKKTGRLEPFFEELSQQLRTQLSIELSGKVENIEELEKLNEGQIKTLTKLLEIHEDTVETQRKYSKTMADSLLDLVKFKTNIQSSGDALAKFMFKPQEFADALDKSAKELQRALTPGNILLTLKNYGDSMLSKSQDLNLNAYNRRVEYMRSIGQDSSTMGGTVDDTVMALRELNVTSEQAMRIQGDLFKQMNSFSELGGTAQTALTRQAAILERIGVSSSTSARLFNSLTKSMGVKDLSGMTTGMANFARALGVSSDKFMNDFTANISQFLRYGPKSIDTFKELAVVAKRTGIEMGDLLGIAKGFDTFEGAADKVGQLNAILGGPFLNTMQFMNETNPAKRIEMLADAIKKSGKDISQYYMSDALTSMLGAKDIETLHKMMGNSVKGIQDQVSATDQLGKSLKNLDAVAKTGNVTTNDAMTTMDENIAQVGKLNGLIESGIEVMTNYSNTIMTTGVIMQSFSVITGVVGHALTVLSLTNGPAAAKTIMSIGNAARSAAPWLLRLGGVAATVFGLKNIYDEGATATNVIGTSMSAIGTGMMFSGNPVTMAIGALLTAGGSVVGSFASGTDDAPGGLSLVGENGPELVVLPQHSSVINNKNLSNLASSQFARNNSSQSTSSSVSNMFGGSQSGPMSLTVVVKLDGDVLAKHTEEIVLDTMEKTMNIVLN